VCKTSDVVSVFVEASAGTKPGEAFGVDGCADGEARVVLASVADVKFAEVLASSTGRDKAINLQTTVTKRNSSPGRARRKPLKPFACGNVG
jgi:hypothetical protein